MLCKTLCPRTRACLPTPWVVVGDSRVMSRSEVLDDVAWERIAALMPSSDGKRGRRFRDHRQVVEGIIYRFRCGIAWRDLPEEFGPWQTGRIPATDATPEVNGVLVWLVAESRDVLRRRSSVRSSPTDRARPVVGRGRASGRHRGADGAQVAAWACRSSSERQRPPLSARDRNCTPQGDSPRFLSLDERIRIADLRRGGLSIRQVADKLGRAPSTVSREIAVTHSPTRAGTVRSRPTAGRSTLWRGRASPVWRLTMCCVSTSRPSSRLAGVPSRSRTGCVPSSRTHRLAGCAPRRSTRPSTALTWAVFRVSFRAVCCAGADVNGCPAITPKRGRLGRWWT